MYIAVWVSCNYFVSALDNHSQNGRHIHSMALSTSWPCPNFGLPTPSLAMTGCVAIT